MVTTQEATPKDSLIPPAGPAQSLRHARWLLRRQDGGPPPTGHLSHKSPPTPTPTPTKRTKAYGHHEKEEGKREEKGMEGKSSKKQHKLEVNPRKLHRKLHCQKTH